MPGKSIVGIFILLLVLLATSVRSDEIKKRNLLTSSYSRKLIYNSLSATHVWAGYPAYDNRRAWAEIPENLRKKTITNAEKYRGYNWPATRATTYLEFTRTGNRAVVDQAISTRLGIFRSLVMAELMEGEGRFMDDIINGVFSFCEQTYWGMSATFYMYKTGFNGHDKPNTVLPDLDDPIVDLFAADTASDLAWAWYFLHDEFDKISPVISKRLKSELQRKILDPYYERYDFWWITGWDVGIANNWNPWCNFNMLTCIALMESDPVKKKVGIYKTMTSVDLFINAYPGDGGCDEGPSYWAVAGGKLFDYLDLLKKLTGGHADLFNQEIIKNIGRYIYRVYISKSDGGQYYVNYSDSPAKINQDPGLIYRFGRAIEDSMMTSFGAFLLADSRYGEEQIAGRMGDMLENLFNLKGWRDIPAAEPVITEFYFPDRDIAVARDQSTSKGFYFAAKGGRNNEGHNHNDVGSFMFYCDGEPVLVDVGVGTYTRETFSSQRYNIWTMQSNYHNLPFVNGHGQSAGGNFKARDSKFRSDKNEVSFSADIAGAYSPEARLDKWVRSYTLKRGRSFVIRDQYRVTDHVAETALHFMTPLPCKISEPGILRLTGNSFILHMIFDPEMLTVKIEPADTDDPKIHRVWENGLSRIVLQIQSKNLSNDLSVKIVKMNTGKTGR
ncbi:MAG: heparinase II/III family protein [Prolixibacteraceae bacterium]